MAWEVTVASDLEEVALPNGISYAGGSAVILSDDQYGQMSANAVATLFSSVEQVVGSGSGTVTSASVVTANGFAGTVANPATTPAVTVKTTVTGLLKGNGTAVSAAVAGTDYLAPGAALTLVASTGAAGYPLVNGTGTIISWAAPADAALHRVMVVFDIDVASGQTGGTVTLAGTLPSGTQYFWQLAPGGSPSGYVYSTAGMIRTVKAGTTLTLSQSSAQTGGAATVWAEMWAL